MIKEEIALIARVLFAEAGPSCTTFERMLVATVISNRTGQEGFGKPATPYDVVTQPRAFSCINDPKNKNWELADRLYKRQPDEFSKDLLVVWKECVGLACGRNPLCGIPPIVYYHDKSLATFPTSWDNKWYRPIFELRTRNFSFYSVEAKA